MIDLDRSHQLTRDVVVFPLTSSIKLTEAVCELLGIKVGEASVDKFADGEFSVQIKEPVRGKDVYFIQSTHNPVNDRIMELLIAIDACKRASAKTINVIIPYYGYARQDRKAEPRQPITSKLVADLLETAGANRVVTIDLHAAQIQGFFDIPADDITVIPLLAKYIKSLPGLMEQDIVIVSPDHGGTARARKLANALTGKHEQGIPVAIIDKRRYAKNQVESLHVLGDVQDKVCILVDDIVDTAGTLQAGIQKLKENGAREVYAACTHGLLSKNAIDRLKEVEVTEFITTNTLDQLEHFEKFDRIKVISVAPLIAAYIEAIQFNLSLSQTLKQIAELTAEEDLLVDMQAQVAQKYANSAS